MNTSRDIEKLFDHFGGNANDYHEIGRENEAISARTRWPLLATLDFAQPAIPEIAPRRDARSADASPAHIRERAAAESAAPTPIRRGKPPLFARAHRRTIPPVDAPASVSLSAARFSSPVDDAASTAESAPRQTPPVVLPASAPAPAHGRLPRRVAESEAARHAPEPKPDTQAPSILGKLFKPAASEAAVAPHGTGSLTAMFDRLRAAGTEADARPARATLAARLPRS